MSTFDYKELTREELDSIFVDFPFMIEPMWHQLVSMAFSADHSRVMFLHGVGTGKTLTSLWCSKLWGNKKILVVCPPSAFSAWERDLSQYTDYSYDFLVGSGRERKAKLKKNRNVFIINYEGLKTIFCNLVKGQGWRINAKSFIYNFDCLILDEIHKCQSYKSLQSRICLRLSNLARDVVGLTGTGFDKSLLDAFNIYRAVDLGSSLGNNFFFYRMNYFKPAGFDWVPRPNAEEKILKKLSRCTLSFERKECFDLPEIQEVVRSIEPSQEFLDLQHKIISDKMLKIGEAEIQLENRNVEDEDERRRKSRTVRGRLLRELSGGFIYYKDEHGEKQAYRIKKNTKLIALMDLIEDTSGKIIIFHRFTEAGEIIQQALSENKYNFVTIRGGQKAEERTAQVKKFQTNKTVKCAIVQQTAGAEGWDGSAAHVAVFFDIVGSPKVRKQCVGRIHRKGQESPCLVVDLELKNSVDKKTLKNRGERFSFVKSVMEYIREYGGVETV